jgi:hypothetical protein
MVCHGDRGQGLTDEWRAVWETDHQNCWARGCHGNRQNDAFNIPTIIPAIMGGPTILGVQTAQDLYEYLKTTHPPQKPGTLTDDEYWAVTAFLFKENSRLPVGTVLGPASSTNWPLFALLAGIMVIMAVWAALLARRKLNSDRVTG